MSKRIKRLGDHYRRIKKYVTSYDAPLWEKVVVLLLIVESRFFNTFYRFRQKARNYFINLVYKKHGDHNFRRDGRKGMTA